MFQWIDAVADPLLVVSVPDACVVAANAAARALFDGRIDGEGQALAALAQIEDMVAFADAMDMLSELAPGTFRLLLPRDDGPARRLSGSLRPLTDSHRLVTLADMPSGVLRRDFLHILDQLPAPIEIYDRDYNALFYNRVADDFFLYDGKDIIQHDDWWEVGFPDPVERAAAYSEWKTKMERARLDRSFTATSEWTVMCRDGVSRMVQFRYRWIGDYFVFSWWDVTTHRQTEQQLRQLAVSDALTGLWNRRRLIEDVQRALDEAAVGGPECSLLLLDIDWFKSINDRFGHGAGDDVLRTLAQRSLAALRTSDVMARMGGEEFAILLPATLTESAVHLAERLLAAIRAPVVTHTGLSIQVTASVGGVTSLASERDAIALMERADRALYRAKESGRDRVVFDGL